MSGFRNLTWVLHSNGVGRETVEAITKCVRELGHEVKLVRLVPFSHESVDAVPEIDGPCICYGSTGLLNLARRHSWQPAGWDGPSFDLSASSEQLGGMMLNHEAKTTTWSGVAEIVQQRGWDEVFIRPDSETKKFAGTVVKESKVARLASNWLQAEPDRCDLEPIVVAPRRQLGREWRFFVIDRRLVGASQYATYGEPNRQPGAPEDVVSFVETIIDRYSPAPCFVADVAEVVETEGVKLKVVEFNSINSAGFYECDMSAILAALSDYVIGAP